MPARLDKEEHPQRTVTLFALQPRQAIPGVTQAQLIFRNSISLSKQILRSKRVLHIQNTTRPTGQIALSDRMDEWISKQNTLIKVASEKQSKTDHHALVEYDPAVTEYRSTPICSSYLHWPSLNRTSKSSWWNPSPIIVAIDSVEARWKSRSVGQDSGSHAIVGNHIKPFCISTSSTIICEPMQ